VGQVWQIRRGKGAWKIGRAKKSTFFHFPSLVVTRICRIWWDL
jgi:hypothetical protein